AEKYPERRKLFLTLMYVAIGLGVMTKGPVAVALPALTFFIYFAATRQLKKIRRMHLVTGALILATIIPPWFGAVYAQHGPDYIATFLLQDNLSRYTQAVWGPDRGSFFYVRAVLGDFFPWSLFLFLVIFALFALPLLQRARRLNPWAAKRREGGDAA